MKVGKIRILIVCMWPLGGIRAFLKYNYHYFPKEKFEIVLLANPTLEKDALEKDMKSENIKVYRAPQIFGRNCLFFMALWLLIRQKYDLIHSQGFTSAFYISVCNIFFGIPHILTMHGIFEKKYFRGKFAAIKRFIFEQVIKRVTVFHCVGEDILNHFQSEFPELKKTNVRWEVIRNGIPIERFFKEEPDAKVKLRNRLQCGEEIFLFGYFGRFMPEKGFEYIIKAVIELSKRSNQSNGFIVLAVGSGDYEAWYKKLVVTNKLNKIINFFPFDQNVDKLIKGCDGIIIPSLHEAYPLLPCEALTAGIPIIASDCMGLREATRETPAISIPPGDTLALADAMEQMMAHPELKEEFTNYKTVAAKRYNVKISAEKLVSLFQDIHKSNSNK